MSELLTAREAAEHLGLSRTATYLLIRQGRLVAVKPLDGELRVRRADLDAFVASLEPVPPDLAERFTTSGLAGVDRVRSSTPGAGGAVAAQPPGPRADSAQVAGRTPARELAASGPGAISPRAKATIMARPRATLELHGLPFDAGALFERLEDESGR